MTRPTDYNDPRLEICRHAQRTDIVSVRHALKNGADPNIVDIDGKTPLIHAAARGSNNIVKVLLTRGVDVNARDSAGESALMCAVRGGYVQTARLLIAAKADIHLANVIGRTAFDYSSCPPNDAEIGAMLQRRQAELAEEKEEKRRAQQEAFWKNFDGGDLVLEGRCKVSKPVRLKTAPRR